MSSQTVYIGTYTRGDSAGIYRCQLDIMTGALSQLAVAANVHNPSYLAVDTARGRLFAVNELLEFEGQAGGSVSAFKLDLSSGELTLVNQVASHGGAPCYLAVDPTGRFAFVANYVGGSVAVLRIEDDGALGHAASIVCHTGSSKHPERQTAAHPHSVVLAPTNEAVFVPDLGLDKVMQYRLFHETGQLVKNEIPWAAANRGSGPRHLAFSPSGRHAYVVGELDSTITAYAYDPDGHFLRASQTVSMLADDYTGANLAADIHLTPDGRFLYASSRGHDSIASYSIDQATGHLTPLAVTPTLGSNPRGFAIDPTGTYLIVANEGSNEIVSFHIERQRGQLSPAGGKLQVPRPVCVRPIVLPVADTKP